MQSIKCVLALAISLFFSIYSVKSQVLNVGDYVPEFSLKAQSNTLPQTKPINIKGKLTILDFWATTCSSCIAQFQKLDSLQRHFEDSLQIILINVDKLKDKNERIRKIYNKYLLKNNRDLILQNVVDSKELPNYFPHQLLPHYVWINSQGVVQAITSSDAVNMQNIQAVIKDFSFQLPIKMDIDYDRPLYLNNQLPKENLLQYSIFLKGRQDGLPSGNHYRRDYSKVVGLAMTNRTILEMYQLIGKNIFSKLDKKRWFFEIRDSSRLYREKSKLNNNEWEENNLYTYELIVPAKDSVRLFNLMLNELNKYSDYYGQLEYRLTKCYALITKDKSYSFRSAGGGLEDKLLDTNASFLRNAPVATLVSWLNIHELLRFPVIDETFYKGNIDIDFGQRINSIEDLRMGLNRVGLELVEAFRQIEVFILKEK